MLTPNLNRNLFAPLLLCALALTAMAHSGPSGVSTNKALMLQTNNVLNSPETNFFAVNSNLLNASVAPSSGGGGGASDNFDPNFQTNANSQIALAASVRLTNVMTTNIVDGAHGSLQFNTSTGSLSLSDAGLFGTAPASFVIDSGGNIELNTTSGENLYLTNGTSFWYKQTNGSSFQLFSSTNGSAAPPGLLHLGPLDFAHFDSVGLLRLTANSNDAFSKFYGDATANMAGIRTALTNISGLSTYQASMYDRIIECNPSGTACAVTLPTEAIQGLADPSTAEPWRPWTSTNAYLNGGGNQVMPCWTTMEYTVKNLGSNTANALLVVLPWAATNGGLTTIVVPNQMSVRITCTGTNGGLATSIVWQAESLSPSYNGAKFTSLNASQLASGTVPYAALPSAVVTNANAGAVTLNNALTVAGTNATITSAGNTASLTLTGNGSGGTSTTLSTSPAGFNIGGTTASQFLVTGAAGNVASSLNGGGLTNLQANALPTIGVSSLAYTNVYTNSLAAASTDWVPEGCTATAASGYTTLAYTSGSGLFILTNHFTAAEDWRMQFEANYASTSQIGACIYTGYGISGAAASDGSTLWATADQGGTNYFVWFPITPSGLTSFTFDTVNYHEMHNGLPTFAGVWCKLTTYCLNGAYTVTVSNETTGAVIRMALAQNLNSLGQLVYPYLGPSGYPTIAINTGTSAAVRNFGFDLIRPTNYIFLECGDSIGSGSSAGASKTGWAEEAANQLHGECIRYGHGGDRTEHLAWGIVPQTRGPGLGTVSEIAALQPSMILNAIGGNDGSLTTNSAFFLTGLQAIAPLVIDVCPTPRYGGIPTPFYLQNWMQTNGNYNYIDFMTSLATNTTQQLLPMYTNDAPHPNLIAHEMLGTVVANYIRQLLNP